MDKENPDQIVLEQLSQAGSNLEKEHRVDLVFYFPTEAKANEAKGPIEIFLQNSVTRIEPSEYDDYLLEAKKNIVPTLTTMEDLRKELSRIASTFDGIYDGWGAMIEK